MHINNKYERHGVINLNEFLTVHDCTEEVCAMQENVAVNIERLKKVLKKKTNLI